MFSLAAGGFDLHAQEATAGLDHDVVAAAVSPGFDYAQAVLGGAGHEKQFCPLAAQLEAAFGRFAVSEHGIVLEIENAARRAAFEN